VSFGVIEAFNLSLSLSFGRLACLTVYSIVHTVHRLTLTPRYIPAIFDPETRTLTLAPATPLYLLSHRVKRLKPEPTDPLAHLQKEVNMYRAQRNDLGETFGTRKAKSRIKAQERNKVDASAMEGVKGHLMEVIGQKDEEEGECHEASHIRRGRPVHDMPIRAQRGIGNNDQQQILMSGPEAPSELIPVPNMTTSDVTHVYPRESIIPSAEWSAIDIDHILKAPDSKSRMGVMPSRRSRWVEDKLFAAMSMPSAARRTNM
jgi:DNA-directed RNA polymerase I subunit RPA49